MGTADGASAASDVVRQGCADAAKPPPSASVVAKGGGGGLRSDRTRLRAALTAYGTGIFALPAD